MNHLCKKFIKKMICNIIISSIMITVFYHKSVIISNADANRPSILEAQEIIDDDLNPFTINSNIISKEIPLVTTTSYNAIFLDNTFNTEESIVKTLSEEINIKPLNNVSYSSEIIPVEDIITDEEKWTSIDYSCEPYTMYVDVDLNSSLNIRSGAVSGKDNIVGGLHYGDEVTVVGYNTYDQSWSAIQYKDKIAFVCNEYLEEWVDLSLRLDSSYENPKWDGKTKLNSVNGKIQGPSGTETYYNLKMDRCIYYMNLLGYDYEVWVRDDGVKMFGDYIMVAANLDIRPKGSLVETSLGTGIVVDTGEFVNWDSTGIDIAVTW